MPELPEVETVAEGLREGGLVGCRIESVTVRWPRTIAQPGVATFRTGLRGRKVTSVGRRGKFLLLGLDNARTLLIHLRMTGHLFFAATNEASHGHEHVVLGLDDGRELRYRDTRKFGRWWLVSDAESVIGHLGPEPLDPAFRSADFVKRLATHRGALKPLLLNQSFIAGLGNIYVDEALWAAGLHPERHADTLTDEDRQRLYRTMRQALRRGLRSMGTTLGSGLTTFRSVWGRKGTNRDKLNVFRRTGQPCPRCDTTIERLIVGQRSTHICPRCQSHPR
jgi:formamidopyrimidine-DNA glycosylase